MRRQSVCLDCYAYTAGSTMIHTGRAVMDGRMLIASSVPHPDCAGRGTLAPGQWADVTVFDPGRVADTATYDDPVRAADGIEWVLVNGRPTWSRGRHLGTRSGQVIGRGQPGRGTPE